MYWSDILSIIAANAVVVTFVSGIYGIYIKEWIATWNERKIFLFEEQQKREAEFYLELWPIVKKSIVICGQTDAILHSEYVNAQPNRREEMAESIIGAMNNILGRMEEIKPFLPKEFISATTKLGDLLAKKWVNITMPTANKISGGHLVSEQDLIDAASCIELVIRRRLGT